MIISFAWTTPSVVIGEKDTTRRDWSPKTIALAKRHMEEGKSFDAYDKSPRFGGKKIGTGRFVEIIESEDSRTIPDGEWEREGFHILSVLGAAIGGNTASDVWRFWREENDVPQAVIRFNIESLTPYGKELDYDTRVTLNLDHNVRIVRDHIPVEVVNP